MYGLYLRDISSYLPLIINELLLLAEPGVRSSEGNWRIWMQVGASRKTGRVQPLLCDFIFDNILSLT